MDDEKKRKTGLGVDVFFPPVSEGAAVTSPPTAVEEQPTTVTAPAPTMERPKMKAPKAPLSRLPKTVRKGVKVSGEAEKEKSEAKDADAEEMIKVTLKVRQDYLDRLEDLKVEERARLRRQGVKNYREQVTVTQLANDALREYLIRKKKL